jgi:hypothetical protein
MCIHCKKKYTVMSMGSTSHLQRHLKACYLNKVVKGRSTKGTLNFQGSNQVDIDVSREKGVMIK